MKLINSACPVGASPQRGIQSGFTLIELMVVVTLAAILLGIGVPSFKDLIVGQRVKAAAFSFTNDAVRARSEAIKRNATVVLQAAQTGWQDGWTVQVGTTPLSKQDGFANIVIASLAGKVTATQLSYGGSGRLNAAVDPLQFSDAAGGHARCISFELSGMPESRQGGC